MATSLNNLAALYRAQGKYAEAEPSYSGRQAVARRPKRWKLALKPSAPSLRSSIRQISELSAGTPEHQNLLADYNHVLDGLGAIGGSLLVQMPLFGEQLSDGTEGPALSRLGALPT